MCGGTAKTSPAPYPDPGLSPRVRGNLPVGEERVEPDRSIPACAGEPPPRTRISNIVMVYPRVCGGTARVRHKR